MLRTFRTHSPWAATQSSVCTSSYPGHLSLRQAMGAHARSLGWQPQGPGTRGTRQPHAARYSNWPGLGLSHSVRLWWDAGRGWLHLKGQRRDHPSPPPPAGLRQGPSPGVPPRGRVALSGDIFDDHKCGDATGICWVEIQSTMQRQPPTPKNGPAPNVTSVAWGARTLTRCLLSHCIQKMDAHFPGLASSFNKSMKPLNINA